MNAMTGKCAGTADARAGSAISLMACDEAGSWELMPNGQAKLGNLCLSQRGLAAGSENVAARAAAHATSSSAATSHGAFAAVDLNEASFWASKFDEQGPVEFTVDFGADKHLDSARISWEFPAKAFKVEVSRDQEHWTQVFATDANMLSQTSMSLGGVLASSLKITMTKGHPWLGVFQGKSVYGIKSISASASRMQPIVDDCAAAATSNDARDKYFAVAVSEMDSSDASALRREMPSLASAAASLTATLAEVSDIVPKLPMCSASTQQQHRLVTSFAQKLQQATGADMEVDLSDAKQLLRVAKNLVVTVRSSLA